MKGTSTDRRPRGTGTAAQFPGGEGLARDWERFYSDCDEAIRASLAAREIQEADREDCRQEVWLEVLTTRLSRFRGGDLRAWLAAVSRNKAIDVLRRRRRHPVGIPGRDLEDGRPASPCLADEARDKVWSALAALDREVHPVSFLVFFLRGIEGWTFGEIAETLGLTAAQARLRHHRTKRKFRDLVDLPPGGPS